MAKSKFNEWRMALSVKGLPFEGNLYKFDPVFNGSVNQQVKCPKCNYEHSTYWKAREDNSVKASLCPRCNKYEVRRGGSETAQKRPSDTRCWATTSKGNRCKNRANANGFCTLHSPKVKPQVVDNGDGSASIHGPLVGMGI